DQVDDVAFVVEGRVLTRGSHRELLERAACGDTTAESYRRVVSRAAADDGDQSEPAMTNEGGARRSCRAPTGTCSAPVLPSRRYALAASSPSSSPCTPPARSPVRPRP